ncbi:MAG: hypothetical protein Q8M16_11460 [Pirellulaceae bacterium]|nr:hypothetical protein [Pirellulaceae bacterium]
MIDFEAQQPFGDNGALSWGTNLTIGSVSFTRADGRLWAFGKDANATTGLSSSYLNQDRGWSSNVVVNFSGGGIYSLGMDVGQLFIFDEIDRNMTISLSSGDQINLSGLLQLFNSPNPLTFVGFTSNTAITQITFLNTSRSTSIDNFAYSSQSNAVPELSSLTLVGVIGFVGFMFQSRRTRRPVV